MKFLTYIFFSVIYFFCIIALIIAINFTIGLTEEAAVFIFLIALIFFLAFSLFQILKKIISLKKNLKRKHSDHVTRKGHRIIVPIILLLIGMIVYHSYNHNLNTNKEIPDSLIEFGNKYPEAQKFVQNYPKYKDKNFNMDVSDELENGTIPLFIQWDKRWGYEKYGTNILGLAGCGPTCLSMIVCGLTGNAEWNPYRVAKFSEEQGYYINEQGTSWELMTTGAQLLGLKAAYGSVDQAYIRDHLTASSPMICSMYPGDFTYTGHFIVLTGIDSNGKIIVNDPNSFHNSNKHWEMDKIFPQIRNIWCYELPSA